MVESARLGSSGITSFSKVLGNLTSLRAKTPLSSAEVALQQREGPRQWAANILRGQTLAPTTMQA